MKRHKNEIDYPVEQYNTFSNQKIYNIASPHLGFEFRISADNRSIEQYCLSTATNHSSVSDVQSLYSRLSCTTGNWQCIAFDIRGICPSVSISNPFHLHLVRKLHSRLDLVDLFRRTAMITIPALVDYFSLHLDGATVLNSVKFVYR